MKLRLQTKYTLAITALILSVFVIVAFVHNWQFHFKTAENAASSLDSLDDRLFERLTDDGRRLAHFLAADLGEPLAAGDGPRVQSTLEKAIAYSGDAIAYAVVSDRRGNAYRAERPAPQTLPLAPGEREARGLDVDVPVFQGKNAVGTLRIGLSPGRVQAIHEQLRAALELAQGMERQEHGYLFAVLILLALGGVALGTITARRLSRPIRLLAGSARAFAEGDLSAPLPPANGHDEVDDLTLAFQGMRESLARTTVSRDFLYRIIDSLNEGLIVTDAQGEIRLSNRAVSEMFGYNPDELVNTRFSDLLVEPQKWDEGGYARVVECFILHRNGRAMPVELSRSLFGDEEKTEQVYVISDIAARKQMEDELATYRTRLEQLVVERTKELTAAVQELESFSYSVSHDLHAPLRAINGFGAALYEDYYPHMDETCRSYLDRMRLATVRMGELIDGLLTLTRVTRSEIRHEPVDMSAIASEIAFEISAGEAPRQVTFRIAPKLIVQSDPYHMRLLLQNLFGNAWKFTRDRSNVVIEFGEVVVDDLHIYYVRDNGIGFDPRDAKGLFRPFHRLHGAEIPGTGIGLATVRRIVQRHGGQVWAEAEPGEGATFFFTLEGHPGDEEDQVDERRVSSRTPESNSVSSHAPSATA